MNQPALREQGLLHKGMELATDRSGDGSWHEQVRTATLLTAPPLLC